MIGEGRGVAQPVGVFQQPGVCIPIQLPPRLAPLSSYHLPAHTSVLLAHSYSPVNSSPCPPSHQDTPLYQFSLPPSTHPSSVNSSTSFTCLFTDSPPSFYSPASLPVHSFICTTVRLHPSSVSLVSLPAPPHSSFSLHYCPRACLWLRPWGLTDEGALTI